MKPVLLIVLVLAVIVGVYVFVKIAAEEPLKIVDMTGKTEISIILTDDGYEPRDVRIDKGTKVIFSTTRSNQHWPASSLHPTHDIYSEFDPMRPIEADEEWSFVFKKEGTWSMHDHTRSYFTGIIYVGK